MNVIANSSTTWARSSSLPAKPFALDDSSSSSPSRYVLDFLLEDVRYEYGFAMTRDAIVEEWLYQYPAGRQQILFEREVSGEFKAGRALKGEVASLEKVTGPRELVLSRGALAKNPQLERVFDALVTGIKVAKFDDLDRSARLRSLIGDVATGTISADELAILLQVADVGIAGAEVSEDEVAPGIRKVLHAIMSVQDDDDVQTDVPTGEISDDAFDEMTRFAARSLKFQHVGAGSRMYPLHTAQQSTGTMFWLSLAAPALRVLRHGGVLCIDELDASLHPQLADVLVQLFRDQTLNVRAAQLIFTTHDTYFMSPNTDGRLDSEEIWLVEKGAEGASELFQLSEYAVRNEQNWSRRYLQGRYGATPTVAPAFLRRLLEPLDREAALSAGSAS